MKMAYQAMVQAFDIEKFIVDPTPVHLFIKEISLKIGNTAQQKSLPQGIRQNLKQKSLVGGLVLPSDHALDELRGERS